MSDVITQPGLYIEKHTGKNARIVHIEDGWAFGFNSDGDPEAWRCSDGESIVGYSIAGPFHEPPTPPEGFELKPKDYVAKEGDRCVWGRATAWHDVSGWKGCCAQELEDQFSARIPVYIASPIPKPAKPEWTCVWDLRWRRPATGWASMTPDVAQILNTLEQRWTNGTDSEWRPVPVTNE